MSTVVIGREKLKRLLSLLAVTILATSLLPMYVFKTKAEVQSIPPIVDPSPGYWETSEYMIGKIAVGIILPESNGSIDQSTEDWTDQEISSILNKIQYSLDWWSAQNPSANVTFVTEVHARVPTSYELISHNFTDVERAYAASEIMTYLGYPINYSNPKPYSKYQIQDYLNDLRKRLNTDWAFEVDIIDASNDADGKYSDGHGASASPGGPMLQVPVKTTDNLDWRVAHELAHIFWATDEYNGRTEYGGYLNVSDIEGSGGIMQTPGSWSISGKPQGFQGTWGQIGWRDSDGDSIQDIVDTVPGVYLNQPEITDNRLNCSGVSAATPYPNKNPYTRNPQGKRDVTINKIQSVQYRIDNGTWLNTSITPTKVKKLMRYPDYYEYKETYAIVNYTFSLELEPGEYFIEIKATNQWGNEGYANQTLTIPELVHDIAITSIKPYRTILANASSTSTNVTVQNKGDAAETFNVTLYYHKYLLIKPYKIETQTTTLPSKQSITLTFKWATPTEIGNYSISVEASQVLGETRIEDNALFFSLIQVSIPGDINADGIMNILDIAKAARAFGSKPRDPEWNANADVNEDGIINIVDIATIAREFGKTM